MDVEIPPKNPVREFTVIACHAEAYPSLEGTSFSVLGTVVAHTEKDAVKIMTRKMHLEGRSYTGRIIVVPGKISGIYVDHIHVL